MVKQSLDIESLIDGANVRLKAGKAGVLIELIGNNRLSLRGTLPPKPGSGKLRPYRQKLAAIAVDNLPKDAPELELSRLLQEYRTCREERLKDAKKSEQRAAMLVLLQFSEKRGLAIIRNTKKQTYGKSIFRRFTDTNSNCL